jgi:3-hydroxyacyl-[acyl-carrier-protein] dehydratase
MLMNDFYRIEGLNTEANTITGTIVFNAEHAIFSGHFPGQPVVPGVCMMKIIKEIMEGAIGQQLLLKSARQVKFLQLVLPDSKVQMHISWKHLEVGCLITAFFKNNKIEEFKIECIFNFIKPFII